MEKKEYVEENKKVISIKSDEIVISDTNSALDFVMSQQYETSFDGIALNKEAISEDFFKLSTGIAGEILQKFINYKIKFAIYGDFTVYDSKSLHDFIYECNNGKDIFFANSQEEAVNFLMRAI